MLWSDIKLWTVLHIANLGLSISARATNFHLQLCQKKKKRTFLWYFCKVDAIFTLYCKKADVVWMHSERLIQDGSYTHTYKSHTFGGDLVIWGSFKIGSGKPLLKSFQFRGVEHMAYNHKSFKVLGEQEIATMYYSSCSHLSALSNELRHPFINTTNVFILTECLWYCYNIFNIQLNCQNLVWLGQVCISTIGGRR